MTGKIFKESSNIYEDQAKILFDYYKKAAEKIVEEEIDIENKIAQSIENKNTSTERQKKHKITSIISVSIAGIVLIGGVICFIIGKGGFGFLLSFAFFVSGINSITAFLNMKKAKKDLDYFEQDLESLNTAKQNIRRDYKVSKLGVAYVPVATRVPFEGKSFIVDHTGTVANTDFSLTVLNKPKELQKSLQDLENNLNNIPVVEGNEDAEKIDTSHYSKSVQNVTMHNYMGNIDREVRNISYLLTDNETRSVSIPVISPNSAEEKFLNEFSTTEVSNKPIVKVFDTEGFDSKLEAFTSISELKKQLEKNVDGDNSNYFKSLIKKLGDSVQIVSKMKTSSTSGLLDYTNSILAAVLKAGYNQYSTELESEELTRIRSTNFNYQDCVESYKPFELKESSKVKYDIYTRNWVAEDNTRTNMPFGINQIEEEVLMPLINNLMQETRIERLKIYNNIKDQKLSYLNKWHQDVEFAFRDNRKAGQDLITEITNAYAEYSTAHNTYISYKQTQNAMISTGSTESGEAHEVESSDDTIKEIEQKVESCREVGDAFQLFMRNLQNDINQSSERFGFVEYFEGSLRDGESKKMADSVIPENLQSLDPRRQKIIPINSYIATYADLPPVPSVEPKLMDDFVLDLQQIAENQINRIDEESSSLIKKHEEENENVADDESQVADDVQGSSDAQLAGDEVQGADSVTSDENVASENADSDDIAEGANSDIAGEVSDENSSDTQATGDNATDSTGDVSDNVDSTDESQE